MSELTLRKLDEIAAMMRAQPTNVYVVQTEEDAARLTKHDPFGHEWKVGDEYYLLHRAP